MLGMNIKAFVFIFYFLTVWLDDIYALPQTTDSSAMNSSTTTGSTYDINLNEELTMIYELDSTSDPNIGTSSELILFDFTKTKSIHCWYELSDANVWPTGMSKAVLVLHKTKQLQEAIFFTILIPQPSGAAFASQRIEVCFNLSRYSTIVMSCRAQGRNIYYKMSLRHNGENNDPKPSYDLIFKLTQGEDEIIKLQLSKFEPYVRGRKDPTADPLNLAQITSFELQMFGGVYEPYKQTGTSSLEIKWIKAIAQQSKNV